MGARIAGELCRTGRLSTKEGNRLLAFCNNIGPIYFLSFVVSTLSLEKPLVPFLVMYGVPLVYGLFVMRISLLFQLPYRMFKERNTPYVCRPTKSVALTDRKQLMASEVPQAKGLLEAMDNAVLSGLLGIAKLGGYMVFFNLLNILFLPFTRMPASLLHAYYCVLEITGGIARSGPLHPFLVLVMLPFGGFSCMAQTYSMIQGTDLSIRAYLWHKLAQTAITVLIYMLWRPF